MRYLLIMIFSLFLLSSCKLMKKKEKDENKSETVMSKNFAPPAWVHYTNIYEVNVRQYTAKGTFNAFSQHLARLKNMGVQTLWFMPITPIAQKNKKGTLGSYYACSDYTAINPEFGNIEDFRNLVKQAHGMGMKVIIDWVANHTGWDHKWTKEHPEYYLKDSATNDFRIASGMDDIIELDFSNTALRKAMIDAMEFWVRECDIDGFRADLAFWVELDFWKEARAHLDKTKPLFWLGEFDELENPDYGEVFDASYTWTWMHRAKDFYQGNQVPDSLYTVLNKYTALGDSTMRAWFTTNHDENSWNGTEYEKYGDMAVALAVFSATWNGVPLIYTGQEIPNKKRIEFFEKDPLTFPDTPTLHQFYKTLLNLRSTSPALRGGDPAAKTQMVATNKPDQVMAFRRKNGNDEVVVILNLSKNPANVELTGENVKGIFGNVFTGKSENFEESKNIEMKPWEYRVLTRVY